MSIKRPIFPANVILKIAEDNAPIRYKRFNECG